MANPIIENQVVVGVVVVGVVDADVANKLGIAGSPPPPSREPTTERSSQIIQRMEDDDDDDDDSGIVNLRNIGHWKKASKQWNGTANRLTLTADLEDDYF
jgi:hypothetical protein